VNGVRRIRPGGVVDKLFYAVPALTAIYIAIVLVPEAARRWPARFISWQEFSLLAVMMLFCFISFRPLYRLRHPEIGLPPGADGIGIGFSLISLLAAAAFHYLQGGCWVIGACLLGAALPPVIRGLGGGK